MKHFTISELCQSDTASKKGIDNIPCNDSLQSLILLADKVLDTVREKFGGPITVNSGYRSPELNAVVNGAKNSQHTKGEAADITCSDNKKLFEIIKQLDFDQLIWEHGGKWIHVSYKKSGNRKQILNIG